VPKKKHKNQKLKNSREKIGRKYQFLEKLFKKCVSKNADFSQI
jgi:hypothetical protein